MKIRLKLLKVLKEFKDSQIISETKDVINRYYNKSVEAIYNLKNHELFSVLENINSYLINRTN